MTLRLWAAAAIYAAAAHVVFAQQPSISDDIGMVIQTINTFPHAEGTSGRVFSSVAHTRALSSLQTALDRFEPTRPRDRQALSALAESIRAYGALDNVIFILQVTLRRFAELRLPVNDPLSDVYLQLYGHAIASSSNLSFIAPTEIGQFLISAADAQRRQGRYRLAAFLYEKALTLDSRSNMLFVKDRLPTPLKLAHCFLMLGEADSAQRYLPSTLSRSYTLVTCGDTTGASYNFAALLAGACQHI
jgi:tetratricopeptide (TPR) repeat protein